MVLSVGYIKEKWQHAGFQKYLRNTGWMFFGRFFALGVSFFVGAYIARYLGPANYGLMNYAISFVGLFGFLASFGIDGIVGREIIKNHDNKDKLIGTAFFLKIIGAILTIALVAVVAFTTTSDKFTLILILLFSLSYIPQAFNVIETYFQSQVLSKNVVRSQIFATIIATILKLAVIFLNKGIFWLLFIYIVEASLVALFLLVAFKYHGHHFRSWKFDRVTAGALLKDSWPLMLSSLAIGIYMKIDQVMVKNILGDEQAGLYAVVVRLSEIWFLFPVIICTSLSSSITKAYETNTDVFEKRMAKLYKLMFWSAFSISISIYFFSSVIVSLLFGPMYIGASRILDIYVWSNIGIFLGTAVGQYLLVSNLTKIYLYTTIIAASVNFTLNILLIPNFGLKGAAISTLFSYSLTLVGLVFFKKTRKHFFMAIKSIK